MAKNPLIIGLFSLLPKAIETVATIVKDKKERKEEAKIEATTTGEAIVDSLKDVVTGSISSKRLLNIGGFGLIITLAISDISSHGITKQNLYLVALGIAYSISMSLITFLSERK